MTLNKDNNKLLIYMLLKCINNEKSYLIKRLYNQRWNFVADSVLNSAAIDSVLTDSNDL